MLPLLRATGIGRNAANITVIGVTLGLTFGAGLLLRDIRSGTLSRRDVWLAIGFLGLAHSLIEDTLLILLIGADLSGILWARLVFAIADRRAGAAAGDAAGAGWAGAEANGRGRRQGLVSAARGQRNRFGLFVDPPVS